MISQKAIRAIVVEDEEGGMDNILLKIERYCPEIEIIATCHTGESAIKQIKDKRPQLVFLDIELGTMSGFDVLKNVQQIPFEVIFTTAFDDYAIQAIKSSAVDYILKPIRPTELTEATEKAILRIQKQGYSSRILVPSGNSHIVIQTKDIIYCMADNVYTNIHRNDKRPFLAVKTLKSVYTMLPKHIFHRVSRSAIVNLDYVESFHRADGGYLIMKDKQEISISKNRLDDFLKKLGGNI